MSPEQFTKVDIDLSTKAGIPDLETKPNSIESVLQGLSEADVAYLEAAFNQLGLNSFQDEIASLVAEAPEQLIMLKDQLSGLDFAVDEVAKRQAAKQIANWMRTIQG